MIVNVSRNKNLTKEDKSKLLFSNFFNKVNLGKEKFRFNEKCDEYKENIKDISLNIEFESIDKKKFKEKKLIFKRKSQYLKNSHHYPRLSSPNL